jgi:hypothetical protein
MKKIIFASVLASLVLLMFASTMRITLVDASFEEYEISDISSITFIPSSLIAYYPFNGNANDESMNGNDGVVTDAILTFDRFSNNNSAYGFNGTSSKIQIPPDNFNWGSSYTISAWVNFDSFTNSQCIFETWNSQFGINIFFHNGEIWNQIKMEGSNNNLIIDASSFNTNQWYFITVTFDGNTQCIYVDAELTGSQSTVGVFQSNDENIYIGYEDTYGERYFDGLIDDIRVFDCELLPDEINALYHEGGWDE